jgi:antitoxin CcdA
MAGGMRICHALLLVEARMTADVKARHPDRRKPTNVSLDTALVEAARERGINISRASEAGVRAELERCWREDNAQAVAAYNAYVDEHGLPLSRFRQV